MKKATPICAFLMFLFCSALTAQVGVYSLSAFPLSEYVWWGNYPVLEGGNLPGKDKGLSEYTEPLRQGSVPVSSFDAACFKHTSNGFHGLHIPFEPSIARLNFNTDLPYRNTWMGGGYAGLDFNPYIGFRGFYFKAMNFGKVAIDTEKLKMYGSEFRLRLPVALCMMPTMMLGGGYLNVNRNYKSRDIAQARSQFFGQGGFGLNYPLSNRFQIQGGARAMLLSGNNQEGNMLRTSWMYNLGIKLVFGKRKKKALPELPPAPALDQTN